MFHASHTRLFPSAGIPVIQVAPNNVETRISNSSTFSCTAFGEPTPTISWKFNDSPLSNGDKYNITVEGPAGEDVEGGATVQSTLVVLDVEEEDEGTYTCVAGNRQGADSAGAFLQPLRECPVSVCMCVCVLCCVCTCV